MGGVQSRAELDQFWQREDPWGYQAHPHDRIRVGELLAALPRRPYGHTVDLGCGDGFVTFELPGERVTGIDLSKEAIGWAEKRAATRVDRERFHFKAASIFDVPQLGLPPADLIVITGVLYPQYIGGAFAAIDAGLSALLAPGGILVSVHISDWYRSSFSLSRLVMHRYPYREYEHLLEVYQR
ncbi:MAG: methyltransferase domain-containing protein [Deltaproteobacteria bacterium]|jgi:SAM-dependent methyltransferase|nr:methyltransferase domain-containing protein [Deltaproteobacteria bacterium]